MSLALGERQEVDAASRFSDPDFDPLTYSATSRDPAVATADASSQGTVTVRAVAEGRTEVVVTATDPSGLSASIGFQVVVENPATFVVASASAPEGGVARLTVSFAAAREAAVSFPYALGVDADPATADADAEDYDDAGGTATIGAGETSAAIRIRIRDDADIEPPREVFTVTLRGPEGVAIRGPAVAVVTIEEGVCDRSAAVRDALSDGDCTAPTATDLAAVRELALNDRGIGSLRTDDLAGLSGLRGLDLRGNALEALPAGLPSAAPALRRLLLGSNRVARLDAGALAGLADLRDLDLSDNALEELPDGLFANARNLRSVHLHGNPGAPFALRLALERTDAAPWSSGPATVRLALPTGAPFEVESELSAAGGTLRDADGALATSMRLLAGATSSLPLTVAAVGRGAVRIAMAVPALQPTICDGEPCWRGMELPAGEPLVLFSRPPTVVGIPAPASLFGETLRLPLDSLARAGDAGDLRWTVASLDEAVATVRIAGDELVVEPADYAEGVARIEVVATDATDQSVVVAFDVYVEFHWPARTTAGWRAWAVGLRLDGSAKVEVRSGVVR